LFPVNFWKKNFVFLKQLIVSLVIVVVVGPEWPAFQEERYQIDTIVDQRQFDFLVWEANALMVKGEAFLTAGHTYLSEETRRRIVVDYLALLGEVRRQEAGINAIYADPAVVDPAAESSELQIEVAGKRAVLTEWQPVVEEILQEQVAVVLAEQGFDILNLTWPPVQMHITPLPLILIVSPREEIRQIYNIPLQHGLNAAEQEEIETAVFELTDLSALIVPIGGLGIYPAMLVETSNINFLTNTIAHEWAHHWLSLHPLGIRYSATPALRTINETVASIVGNEIGAIVIERYYPEFVPVEQPPASSQPEPGTPPPFDFNQEMALTRIRVDELLAEGNVEEAESYMEDRRQFFWDNGYRIRKLNQAYFAFYGAYADSPGQSGDDPIGPALAALRQNSPSLRVFLDDVAPIGSLDELLELSEMES
jgi:hypothetical protein